MGVPWVNVAVAANFLTVMLVQACASCGGGEEQGSGSSSGRREPRHEEAAERFGPQLQVEQIRELMAASREPHQALVGMLLLTIFATVPWYGEPGEAAPPFLLGVPRWGCIMLAAAVASMLFGFGIVFMWRPGGPGSGDGTLAPGMQAHAALSPNEAKYKAGKDQFTGVTPEALGKASEVPLPFKPRPAPSLPPSKPTNLKPRIEVAAGAEAPAPRRGGPRAGEEEAGGGPRRGESSEQVTAIFLGSALLRGCSSSVGSCVRLPDNMRNNG